MHNRLTTFPFVCIYEVSSLTLSLILSSSSDPSTLSKALALATGDLGEVGLKKFLFKEPECANFPVRKYLSQEKIIVINPFNQTVDAVHQKYNV